MYIVSLKGKNSKKYFVYIFFFMQRRDGTTARDSQMKTKIISGGKRIWIYKKNLDQERNIFINDTIEMLFNPKEVGLYLILST